MNTLIQKLIAEGLNLNKIRGTLLINDYTPKEIEEGLKAAGLIGAKKGGLTQSDVLLYISSEPRTELDLAEFILSKCANNEARWFSDRNKTRSAMLAIHNKYLEAQIHEVNMSVVHKIELKHKAKEKSPYFIDLIGASKEKKQEKKQEEKQEKKEEKKDKRKEDAWNFINRAKASGKKFTRKNGGSKYHPDKVAEFNDEELTKAYNDFFRDNVSA